MKYLAHKGKKDGNDNGRLQSFSKENEKDWNTEEVWHGGEEEGKWGWGGSREGSGGEGGVGGEVSLKWGVGFDLRNRGREWGCISNFCLVGQKETKTGF